MNVEPRKIVTFDGVTIILTANEVRELISDLKWAHISANIAHPTGRTTFKLQRMLEEKCTL